MSLHSNIQSQNPQAEASHRNQPNPPPSPQSQNIITHPPPAVAPKQWVATYLEGQFYLTDPESISKLKNIEAEIENQRLRLAQLEQNSISHNHSFLSFQEEREERASNHSFCTQFDQSRHFNKQQEVKNDLEQEEELYRQKLRLTEKEKIECRKSETNVKDKKQAQINTPALSSKKQSYKDRKEEEEHVTVPLPVTHAQFQRSSKMSKKASQQEQKEKSYHKSRIEKSIKESVKVNQQFTEQSPEKSVKGSVKPNQQEAAAISVKQKTQKSINIVIVQPDHTIMSDQSEKNVQKSAKGSISPEKSAKRSVIPSLKDEKEESVKIFQPAASEKSGKIAAALVKISQKHAPSKKSSKLQLIQENKSSKTNQNQEKKSIHAASIHDDQLYPSSPTKSHKSTQLHQFLQVQPKQEQAKSVKNSEKVLSHHQKTPSHKAESVKLSEKQSIAKKPEKQAQFQQQKIETFSQKVASHHQLKSQKAISVAVVQQQPQKSVRSPSKRGSSRHSKAKQLQKSIKLSEQLNAEPIIIPPVEKSVKKIPKEQSVKSLHPPVENGEARSKKSSKLIVEEDAKSKRSNYNIEEVKSEKSSIKSQIKSHKEQIINNSIVDKPQKSQKSDKIHQIQSSSVKSDKKQANEQIISQKSKQTSVKEQIVCKKSQKIALNQQIVSQKSSKAPRIKQQDSASKKSHKIQADPPSPVSQKSKQQQPQSKSVVSQRHSFSKKSAIQLIQAVQAGQNSPQSQKSILKSQLSQKIQRPLIKQTGSELQHSVKGSSSLNGESLKQSSRVIVVVNQLPPEVKEAVPQYNMRKQKAEDNQGEKKSRSFVIHSRNGSVKDKLNNSQISSSSIKSKDLSSVVQESVTKGEIIKLHEQITLLQEKLRRVEERQQQMERLQVTLSKIHLQEEQKQKQKEQEKKVIVHKEVIEPQNPIAQVKVQEAKQVKQKKVQEIPQIQLTDIQIRPQPRLQIQSSILQVNTMEQVRKKHQRQQQHGEKARLKDEIGRLKRIIRDMQIQKIRSIDLQAQDPTPQASRVENNSLSSIQGTHTRRFGSTNKRLLEDAGRIVPNNSSAFHTETPKRKSVSKLKLSQQEGSEIGQLPSDSGRRVNNKGKLYVEARRVELAAKINQKQRDFHSFIESSRVIAEETGRPQPQINNLKNFSKVTVEKDVDYSRLVQEMKKPNPQQEQVLPEIHLRDLQMPALPEGPHASMTQEQLLSLARNTYMTFGIDVQAEGRQLCVKKYKNCVIFTLDGQTHQCILWHFSGKFYMGSWRAGQPGEGEKQGEGLELVAGKYLYKGQFLTGKRHGSGILKQTNGNIYDGQWSDGLKNGRGVYLDAATRVLYSGEWRQGRKEGQGFLKLSQKEYYIGTFVKSIKEGFGVQVFVNGDKYRGQYKGGKFHGRGKYLWANGSCYQGQFCQGVRHGQGSWRSARNNPDIYIGSYDKDKKTGYGRYVWANGCMYEGGFANDLKHGKGRLTYQDGKEIKGTWEQGNLVSTEQEKRQVDHQDEPLRRSVKVISFLPASAKRI